MFLLYPQFVSFDPETVSLFGFNYLFFLFFKEALNQDKFFD